MRRDLDREVILVCDGGYQSSLAAATLQRRFEETGGLDNMLNKVADFYEDQVAAAIKSLTSILEPLMIVFVGAVVGFIVISMYLPIFSLYDKIR